MPPTPQADDRVPDAANYFSADFCGSLSQVGDPDYDQARSVWNAAIDKRPALIVRCTSTHDVVRAVAFARDHSLLLAVRGGGHNVAGQGTCEAGMVIDLCGLKSATVDPVARTVRAQGGLTWGELDAATQAHGLAVTGGLVSSTGVGGFTTGGGIGWLMRQHGLALDNLQQVEMVLADGRVVTASHHQNPDLFWGVRGGGGNFGIVTEFTFRLHPVGPLVYGGPLFYPLEQAGPLLQCYRRWLDTIPDALTSMVVFMTAPPAPFIPARLQGTKMVAVAMCLNADLAEGESLVAPLRSFLPPAVDLLGPIPYVALQSMFDDSAPRGLHWYWKTEYLSSLDDAAIDQLTRQASLMESPVSAIHLHHVQGAVSRVLPDQTAFSHRGAPFILNLIGGGMEPGHSVHHTRWAREAAMAMKPYANGDVYLNFLGDEGDSRVRGSYGANFERLAALKSRYDPTNLFRVNHNIRPA